jgi:hypothetical protein
MRRFQGIWGNATPKSNGDKCKMKCKYKWASLNMQNTNPKAKSNRTQLK